MSNMKVELFLPHDFLLACDLYYEQPERVIQQFVESVSFPEYYSGRANKEKEYGTSFFLEFQKRPNNRPFPAKKIREKYLDYQIIVWDTAEELESINSKFELLTQFYREWHFELIKNISRKDAIINQTEREKYFGYKFK